jgi:short-subunit dehydrogenase
MEKVIIITGANSGIGLATAKLLTKKGYTVYGIARRGYDGEDFYCYKCDVNDGERLAEILKEIYNKHGCIDGLINNAGFGIAGAIEDASLQAVNAITQTNFVSVVHLCTLAIPYLKLSGGGKIINISSVGGIMPLPYQAVYSANKAAVEVFSRALDNEVNGYNIRVCAVLPGDTKTGFTSARVTEENKDNASYNAMKRSVSKMEHDEQNGKSPESVAKVIYNCIKKKRPPLRVSVGALSKIEVFLSRLIPTRCLNLILKKLYG